MKCKICNSTQRRLFCETILAKYNVEYFYCESCGFLQTEKPYWLSEAYSNAISCADTGLVKRNLEISRNLSILLYCLFGKSGHYIDFAGGTGLLVRLMRDIGFDFYWKDAYCQNIHAIGFDLKNNHTEYNAITAFELLEHLENPIETISEIMRTFNPKAIIFSTQTFTPPPPRNWWYYSFETGQHISFYQQKTLRKIAEKISLQYCQVSQLHIMTKKSLSFILPSILIKYFSFPTISILRRKLQSKTLFDHKTMLTNPK